MFIHQLGREIWTKMWSTHFLGHPVGVCLATNSWDNRGVISILKGRNGASNIARVAISIRNRGDLLFYLIRHKRVKFATATQDTWTQLPKVTSRPWPVLLFRAAHNRCQNSSNYFRTLDRSLKIRRRHQSENVEIHWLCYYADYSIMDITHKQADQMKSWQNVMKALKWIVLVIFVSRELQAEAWLIFYQGKVLL